MYDLELLFIFYFVLANFALQNIPKKYEKKIKLSYYNVVYYELITIYYGEIINPG